jgi:hypothetical protein
MSTLRDRLAASGVSQGRLSAIGLTEPATEAEAAAVAAVNAEAAVQHDAQALDAYVRYVAGNAFQKSKIRAEVGSVVLAHGKALLSK